jgi:hypothetical protein
MVKSVTINSTLFPLPIETKQVYREPKAHDIAASQGQH